MTKIFFALSIVLLSANSVFAGIIYFEDNFDSENSGVGALNYSAFTNWTVSDGTVDLIGTNFHDLQPGNGLYLDMDGSTFDAGKITASFYLDAGDYLLDFYFAGNQRTPSVDRIDFQVSKGITSIVEGYASNIYQHTQFISFSSILPATFTAATDGIYSLSFEGWGGDNEGVLLDNISVERTDPVPEPVTLLLFGTGLVGLVGSRLCKKKQ